MRFVPQPYKETGLMALYNSLLGRLRQEDGKFKGQSGLQSETLSPKQKPYTNSMLLYKSIDTEGCLK